MGLKDILKRPVINRCRRIYEKRRHACLGTLEERLMAEDIIYGL